MNPLHLSAHLVSRFTLRGKFLLVGTVFALALGVFVFAEIGRALDATRLKQHELEATARIVSLLAVHEDMLTHRRLMLRDGRHDHGESPELADASKRVLEGLRALATRDAAAPNPIVPAREYDAAIAGWTAMTAQLPSLPRNGQLARAAFDLHVPEINRSYRLLALAGEAARFKEDVDVVVTAVGAMVARDLPRFAGLTGRLRALSLIAASDGMDPADARQRVAVASALLRDARASLDLALAELFPRSREVANQLQDPFARQFERVDAAMARVDDQISRGNAGASGAALYDALAPTVNEGFALVDRTSTLLETMLTRQISETRLRLMTVAALGAGALGLSAWLFWGMFVSMQGAMREVRTAARRLAEGDLTTKITISTQDEFRDLGHELDRSIHSFASLISGIQAASAAVSGHASEMATAASQVAAGSRTQAHEAAGTAAAVEQVTTGIAQVSDNVAGALSLSEAASRRASEGGALVSQAAEETRATANAVRVAGGGITALGERSEEIGRIVAVIRDIADQTNLLALNAAIEAARAGEQGRGFAVVADEVRKLAERTGESTREIAAMVEAIQTGTREAVESISQSSRNVEKNVARSEAAAQALATIEQGSHETTALVNDLANAMREQRTAAESIARHVEAIARMTEENDAAAHSVEQAAAATQAQADRLRELVQRFRT